MSRRDARAAQQRRADIWEGTLTCLTWIACGAIVVSTLLGLGFGLRLGVAFITH